MRLYANRQCRTCHGKGWVQESRGEVLDCDCIFIGTTHTDEEIDAALASRTIEVVPDTGDPILDLMESANEAADPNPANDSGVRAQHDRLQVSRISSHPQVRLISRRNRGE